MKSIKVTVSQVNPMKLDALDHHIGQLVAAEKGIRPDIIVLPENFCDASARKVDATHPFLKKAKDAAKKHKVHILLGSLLVESHKDKYVCSVMVDCDGEIVGSYRKIHAHAIADPSIKSGSEPGVFKTRFGNIGVLIGADIEFPDTVKQVINSNPVLILNPACAANPPTEKQLYNSVARAAKNNWKTSLKSISEKLEQLCASEGVAIVRADQPFPEHKGSSMIVTPHFTHHADSMFENHISAVIDFAEASGLKKIINCGRYHINRLIFDHKTAQDWQLYLQLCCADVHPVLDFLVLVGSKAGELYIWDSIKEEVVMRFHNEFSEIIDAKFFGEKHFVLLLASGHLKCFEFSKKEERQKVHYQQTIVSTLDVPFKVTQNTKILSFKNTIFIHGVDGICQLSSIDGALQKLDVAKQIIIPTFGGKICLNNLSYIFYDSASNKYLFSSNDQMFTIPIDSKNEANDKLLSATFDGSSLLFQTVSGKEFHFFMFSLQTQKLQNVKLSHANCNIHEIVAIGDSYYLSYSKDSKSSEENAFLHIWKLDQSNPEELLLKLNHRFKATEHKITGVYAALNIIFSFHFEDVFIAESKQSSEPYEAIFSFSCSINKKTAHFTSLFDS
jgi:predicted amidohydrolase